jgi:hypothetical protein
MHTYKKLHSNRNQSPIPLRSVIIPHKALFYFYKSTPITGLSWPRGWIEVQLYPFVTSALEGCGWSAPRPDRFTPGKDPVPIVQEAGWAPGPVWTYANNFAPTGNLIPVASRYTDCTTGPTFCFYIAPKILNWSFICRSVEHSIWQHGMGNLCVSTQ